MHPYMYICIHKCVCMLCIMYMYVQIVHAYYMTIVYILYVCITVFDRMGQIGSKMASVCAPLGIHLEPINKELMLLVTI